MFLLSQEEMGKNIEVTATFGPTKGVDLLSSFTCTESYMSIKH
jgi:hypothetical protein